MKAYVVYVDGEEVGVLMARNHNEAEKKAKRAWPNRSVSVEYTEV